MGGASKTGAALPVTSDEKGALPIATAAHAVAVPLLVSQMANTVTATEPKPRLRSGRNSAHC